MDFHKQERDSEGRERIDIRASWEEVAEDYEDIVREYAGLALPGFRAGKAPLPLVKKRFRKEIARNLATHCCPRFAKQVLKECDLKSIGPGQAVEAECDEGNRLQFQLHFFPAPEFDIPDVSPLKLDPDNMAPRDQLSRYLLDVVTFNLPDPVIEAEVQAEEPVTRGSAEWQAAEERVRLMIILKRIAVQDGIEIDETDVDDRIRDTAANLGATEEELRAELEHTGGRERLRDLLLAEAVLDYLLEQCS